MVPRSLWLLFLLGFSVQAWAERHPTPIPPRNIYIWVGGGFVLIHLAIFGLAYLTAFLVGLIIRRSGSPFRPRGYLVAVSMVIWTVGLWYTYTVPYLLFFLLLLTPAKF